MDRVAGAYVRGGLRVSSDPLGYGLFAWKSQWMGPWAEGLRARLQVRAGCPCLWRPPFLPMHGDR